MTISFEIADTSAEARLLLVRTKEGLVSVNQNAPLTEKVFLVLGFLRQTSLKQLINVHAMPPPAHSTWHQDACSAGRLGK